MSRSTYIKLESIFRQNLQMDISFIGSYELLSAEKKIKFVIVPKYWTILNLNNLIFKLLIALWYLAKEGSMFATGDFFNVVKSTVKKVVDLMVTKISY